MSKHVCLYGFLVLFIASMSMQILRAKMRKKIVRQYDPSAHGTEFEDEWEAAGRGLGIVFHDSNKMRLLKKNSHQLPNEILEQIRKFKILSAAELTTTISMLLVAAFAYLVCN